MWLPLSCIGGGLIDRKVCDEWGTNMGLVRSDEQRVKWCSKGVRRRMKRQGRKGEDVVAEGLWLTAEAMNQLLHNQRDGGLAMSETMWKCDQIRAGQLYNRMMFDTQVEAQEFMQKMRQMEPDQMFSVEAIEARQVWN